MEDEQQVTELQSFLDQAKAKYAELDKEYGSFTTLRDELKAKTTEISKFHDSSSGSSKSIEQLLAEVQQITAQVKESQASIDKIKADVETYNTKFLETKASLDDGTNGLTAVYDTAQVKRDEIIKKYEEIVKTQIEAEALRKQIETLRQESEGFRTQSEEFKNSIANILDLVTATGLAGSFTERRNKLRASRFWWSLGFWTSIVLLSLSVIYIYSLQSLGTNGFKDWHSWYRYLFTSPLIYLVYVCSHNYKMERDYEERYAFKAVLSTSLESYIKLLVGKFPDAKDALLDYTLRTITTIYEKPYFRKDRRAKINFAWKIVNAGVELGEKTVDDGQESESKQN